MSEMPEILEIDPSAGGISGLLKAALPSVPALNKLPGIRKTGGEFTGLARTRPTVTVDRVHAQEYAAVCGFPAKDSVPLTYPHLLAFDLQMAIMTSPEFPYPAIGTVHLENSVTSHRRIYPGEKLDVVVRAEPPRPHDKGATVDFVSHVRCGGELVWESTSRYLRRGVDPPGASAGTSAASDLASVMVTDGSATHWRLAANLGRQYAAVSGDHNPIHLYPLTAKALGFPRQIAHGMWSMARCVAAVENRLPDAVRVEAAFKKPILLPSTVAFGLDATESDNYAFSLSRPRDGAPHLVGRTLTL